MSAETCAEKTQPTRSVNKTSGCGGVGTVKKRIATADAAAHDCCHHEQAAHALPSSTRSTGDSK